MSITLKSIQDRILGKVFGKLTILEYAGRSAYRDNLWLCKCACGAEVVGRTADVTKPTAGCRSCKVSDGPGRLKLTTRLLNKTFGRLTVLHYSGQDKHNNATWLCQCECGGRIITRGANLTSGATRSCGCYAQEQKSFAVKTHGLSNHPLYSIWAAMKDRCYNANNPEYKNYGGRANLLPIEVCDEWLHDFKAFYDWSMSHGYTKGLTLDRWPDNNGPYDPSNCRWATRDEQSQNMRSTMMNPEKVVAIRADPRVHSEIAEDYGVDESTISRIITRRTWKNIA